VIYGAAQRWTEVIDEVRAAGKWPDTFLAAAAGVAHGVAAANLGLFTEASADSRRRTPHPLVKRAPGHRLVFGDGRRGQGNEEAAVALLEWLQTTTRALKLQQRLKIRLIVWRRLAPNRSPLAPIRGTRPVSWPTPPAEKLLAEAEGELQRQIGLTRVKDQVERYRAATQMARVRAARGMKVAQPSKHMISPGHPVPARRRSRGCGQHPGGVRRYPGTETDRDGRKTSSPNTRAISGQDHQGDRSRLGGVLFIDEAYALVQERDGRTDRSDKRRLTPC